jgi:hypothetical protein
MRLAYCYDLIAGTGVVNVYYLPNSIKIWDPLALRWRTARKGEKGYWSGGRDRRRSNRIVPMFQADDGKLFGRLALAAGMLPKGARGRLVLWFFGKGLVGLLHAAKYWVKDWDWAGHADLPKEIREQFPEKKLENMAWRLFPGDLDAVGMAAAQGAGLTAAMVELDRLEGDLRRSLDEANRLRESINHVLSLGGRAQ